MSVCAFSVMDAIVKWSDTYPVGQVLFFRGFCGMIRIFFLIPRERYFDFYKTSRPFLHFKRYDHDVYMFLILQNIPERTVEADFLFEASKREENNVRI